MERVDRTSLDAALFLVVASLFTLAACSGCAPEAQKIDTEVARAIEGSGESKKSEAGPTEFDHSAYGELLEKHVIYEKGLVDYTALKKDEEKLDIYIDRLGDAELESLTRGGQLALLLNAYNAFTLKLILENYGEIESIRDIDDPWGTKRWEIAGDKLSLDNIEHGLIRPIFKDPRIHFAVNCAARGCPPLADFPFTGEGIDVQLQKVTHAALSNPRYAKVEDETLYVTKVMDWYGEDFTKKGWSPRAASIPKWVAERSTEEIADYVEQTKDPELGFLEYDWSLNDVGAR